MRLIALPGATGFMILFSAAVMLAQQAAQDWIPEAIDLPADMEVMVDRAIGSSTRIFSFATGQDAGALIDRWTAALEGAGYVVERPVEALETRQIEFSGPGIGNAKIAVQPSAEEARTVVQFDASLTD